MAHRTSPTNIGMGLLSTLAAHDLGFLPADAMLERLERTLTTVEGLERHEGHLLNWYDTRNLSPLLPRYVSTVDSGNLAGALARAGRGVPAPGRVATAARDPPPRPRPARQRFRRRNELRVPLRPRAPALLDRLPAGRLRSGPAGWTAPTTTSSPRRRASRASSPSPRGTCRRATGSTSGGSS